jgi:hypothetical protein
MRYVETVIVKVNEPLDYPGNARIHDELWLDESAQTNGQYRAVLARRTLTGELQLLAGHGTRAAFARRGDKTIRVEVIEADDREARRINLVDNPRPGIGGFDHEALLALLDAAQADGGIMGSGWNQDAYEDLVKMAGDPPSLDDLEDEHGEPAETDLWPVLKIAVPPETAEEFHALMNHAALAQWGEEAARFGALLHLAQVALDAR